MHSDGGSPRRSRHALHALWLGLLSCASPTGAQKQQDSFAQVERVIAFADVHGAYDELAGLLRSVGVIDANLRWSAGAARVVSLGDLLDRGAGSRKAMDLLMRLQGEAGAAGGALHVVLGNHEAMNLVGDLREVTPAEFAAYIGEEPPGLRERLRGEWVAGRGNGSEKGFDEHFPPGFFGQRAALSKEGKYGRWLLSLPAAIVIGDTLFMHGGPSQVLSGLSLQEINLRYRSALSEYLSALGGLMAAGLVDPGDPFEDRADLAERRLAAASLSDANALRERTDVLRRFIAADRDPMLDSDGPSWSRGAARCNETAESDVLRPLLAGLGVKHLVIGHTPTRDQRVASRFDGAVIELDSGMNRAVYHGHPAALLLEHDAARVVYADEDRPPAGIPAEPLYVSSPIPDDVVASVLTRGKVTVSGTRAPGTLDVVVELGGLRVPAAFVEARGTAMSRELAAYRLDRALRLGLVPATVPREVQGQQGFLQARPARWASQADVDAKSLQVGGWCAIPPQLELMDAFDAVIGNEGRTPERVLYDASDWMLLLTGHERAFGASKALPVFPPARAPRPGAEMRRRLATLDATSLVQAVGDLLSESERAALLARRDALLTAPAR